MTTIDISKLSPEEKAAFLKQFSPEDLKAGLKTAEEQKAEDRKAYKETVNETVPTLIKTLQTVSIALQNVKLDVFQSLRYLLDMKAEAFDIKQGQQSHSFSDENGNGISYGFRVNDGWDDTVNAGIDKINNYLQSLAKDENSAKAVAAINKLLKKDAKGNLKSSRVLELRAMADEFNNAVFTDGVDIIQKAFKPVRSSFFIEAWTTDAGGRKHSVPLSITSVEFPVGTVIEDLFPIESEKSVESEETPA